MSLKIYTTKRFVKAYRKAIFALQNGTERSVHDFANRWDSDPRTVTKNYDTVQGLQPYKVLEIDIGGGCRLLDTYTTNRLILLDMGRLYIDGFVEIDI